LKLLHKLTGSELNCGAKMSIREAIREVKLDTPTDERDPPSLGILRLDYKAPVSPGEISCSETFTYKVHYKCVPGLTFAMCQSGKMPKEVEKTFVREIKWLLDKGVTAISASCGYMMWFQHIARRHTKIPVVMSSLCILPAVTTFFAKDEEIIIMTANSKTMEPMRDLIRKECGVDTEAEHFHIVGCQDIDGFEAVLCGYKVDFDRVEPGVVKKAIEALKKYPKTRAFVLECTQLPPFADSIRYHTRLPVFDIITACNFVMESVLDNPRFGLNNWQKEWDGTQEDYKIGDHLTQTERDISLHFKERKSHFKERKSHFKQRKSRLSKRLKQEQRDIVYI